MLISDPTVTTYTFTSLAIGVVYRFRFAAINDVFTLNCLGCSLQFSDYIEQMAALVPIPVTGLAQDSNQYHIGKVTMKWNFITPSGTPTLSYSLLKDNGVGVYYILYQGSNNSYTDIDLIPGQSYNYKVYASNYIGDGPISTSVVGYAAEYPSQPFNF